MSKPIERQAAQRVTALAPAKRHDAVIVYPCDVGRSPRSHEIAMQGEVAKTIAAVKQCAFAGIFEAATRYPPSLYLVPSTTLAGLDVAQQLGLHDEQDLFGGVVPFPFVGNKTITHQLADADAQAPKGWSFDFGQRVQDAVLPGFSAFALRDAQTAGVRLLRDGAVRVKKATGVGGLGQSVVTDLAQLEAQLQSMSDEEWRDGIVLERNLRNVTTLSVGQARVHDLLISYVGTQRLTKNNHGDEVYGGSSLCVVRGDYEALLLLDHADEVRTAIAQARTYHDAALASYAGMYASRCNYDIAQGLDEAGRWCSGVLEQSWRVGGASCAEVAALDAFHNDAALDAINASTTEIYGANPQVPADANVYYSGVDEHVGQITKYSQVQDHAHA